MIVIRTWSGSEMLASPHWSRKKVVFFFLKNFAALWYCISNATLWPLACAKTRNTETPRNTINNKVSGSRVLKAKLTVPLIIRTLTSRPSSKLSRPGIGLDHFPRHAQNPVALFKSTLEVCLQARSYVVHPNDFLVLNLLFERKVSLKVYCKHKKKFLKLNQKLTRFEKAPCLSRHVIDKKNYKGLSW